MNWHELPARARRVYSQTGEDGILEAIFELIGPTSRYLVDIGAGDGCNLSNTRLLLERGWHGALFDAAYGADVHQERITAENVCEVLARYRVPREFDLLSLDIDGIDWYVLRALLRCHRPRVCVCEINGQLPEEPAVTIQYDPAHNFDGTDYYGASLGAFRLLAQQYRLHAVHVEQALNAFFVLDELLPPDFTPATAFTPRRCWPADPRHRPWVTLGPDEDYR